MRRLYGLNVSVAFPGTLGPRIDAPPAGFVPYGDGYQAINDEGDYANWIDGAWMVVQNIEPPVNPPNEDDLFVMAGDDDGFVLDDDGEYLETYES